MHIARGISSLAGALAIVWGLSIPAPRLAEARDFGATNGTWEGSLGPVSGPGLLVSNKPLPIRLIVRDETAQVFTGENFNEEVKSGRFKVERFATNMIIFALDSGKDNDGVWVETWAFVITQKERNILITNLYRVVNNTDVPLSIGYTKFSSGEAGELKRISPE